MEVLKIQGTLLGRRLWSNLGEGPPSQALSIILFTQDVRNQDALEAMPKIDGRTMTAEPLWTMLQNMAASIGDREITTRKDSDTTIQQEGWTKDTDCYMSDSQMR
jgi:hypothetical protein